MPIPRSPKGVRWLRTQTFPYAILSSVFAAAVGGSAAWNLASQGRPILAIFVGLGTAGILVSTAVQQSIGLAAARRKDSTHELEGCLYTLYAVLLAPGTDCRLRLAIHVPVGEMLEQVTESIGDRPKRGRIGRQFPANAGIIGKAFREEDVFIGRRVNDDYESYVKELVTEWNFTEEQARKLNPGAMEWMAVPFHDTERQRVEAVLFLDVNVRDFFTPERQELVLAAVSGIAVFIGKRYA
jgi:hypothetical protein